MGEIADMMLDGILDCETGEYLGPECGFPRTAADMRDGDWHRPLSAARKRTLKRAAQRKRARDRKRAGEQAE